MGSHAGRLVTECLPWFPGVAAGDSGIQQVVLGSWIRLVPHDSQVVPACPEHGSGKSERWFRHARQVIPECSPSGSGVAGSLRAFDWHISRCFPACLARGSGVSESWFWHVADDSGCHQVVLCYTWQVILACQEVVLASEGDKACSHVQAVSGRWFGLFGFKPQPGMVIFECSPTLLLATPAGDWAWISQVCLFSASSIGQVKVLGVLGMWHFLVSLHVVRLGLKRVFARHALSRGWFRPVRHVLLALLRGCAGMPGRWFWGVQHEVLARLRACRQVVLVRLRGGSSLLGRWLRSVPEVFLHVCNVVLARLRRASGMPGRTQKGALLKKRVPASASSRRWKEDVSVACRPLLREEPVGIVHSKTLRSTVECKCFPSFLKGAVKQRHVAGLSPMKDEATAFVPPPLRAMEAQAERKGPF
uniref:Uncharacterized protein n=1 Tax=Parascaris univalens TaxID=6257 RepID=A0A915CJM7_PARUN